MSQVQGPDADRVREALRAVIDPELGVDIVELGLITQVDVHDDGGVFVRLVPTSPSCPVGDLLRTQARDAVATLPGVGPIEVELDRGLAAAPPPAPRASRLGVAIRGGAAPSASEPCLIMRGPFLLVGLSALVIAAWAGMARAAGDFPVPVADWLMLHGPLMVSGFLGTVIALERAVGVGWRAAWSVPILAALGAISLALALPAPIPAALTSAASLALVGVYIALLSRRPSGPSAVEATGAVAWLIGNLAWLAGATLFTVVPWWMAFLVLIIVGERVELGQQVKKPSPAVQLLLPAGILITYTGALAGLMFPAAWPPIVGAGFLTLAIWLWVADAARETIKRPGLPRFTAWCLLSGYFWLTAAAIVFIVAPIPAAGLLYDVVLHAVFVGFVVAMIFGHAPIIFPAILHRPIPFSPWFYLHLLMLQVGLVIRVYGGLTGDAFLRTIGAHSNAVAIAVFLVVTIGSIVRGGRVKGS